MRGVYDNHVYRAQTPEDAISIINDILGKEFEHKLENYFQKEYYDKLPALITKCIDGGEQ